MIKYTAVAAERSLKLEISLQVDITNRRNTVNRYVADQSSSISVLHHPRNPGIENSEIYLVWFVPTKGPEMET